MPDLPVAAPDPEATIRRALDTAANRWGPIPGRPGDFEDGNLETREEAFAALAALLAERQQDKRARLELVALTLAVYGDTGSKAAETIPQQVWDDLHERGLVRTGQDFTGEGSTDATSAGRDYLIDALASLAAALAVEEDAE